MLPAVPHPLHNVSIHLKTKVQLYLIFHPFLVIELDILLVLATGAVGFSHRRRVVGQVRVAVVAIVFRHWLLRSRLPLTTTKLTQAVSSDNSPKKILNLNPCLNQVFDLYANFENEFIWTGKFVCCHSQKQFHKFLLKSLLPLLNISEAAANLLQAFSNVTFLVLDVSAILSNYQRQ